MHCVDLVPIFASLVTAGSYASQTSASVPETTTKPIATPKKSLSPMRLTNSPLRICPMDDESNGRRRIELVARRIF